MQKQRALSIDIAGRDLLRLEQAARDMGVSPDQLLQLASDAASRPLFSFPRMAPAKVLTLPIKSTEGVHVAAKD